MLNKHFPSLDHEGLRQWHDLEVCPPQFHNRSPRTLLRQHILPNLLLQLHQLKPSDHHQFQQLFPLQPPRTKSQYKARNSQNYWGLPTTIISVGPPKCGRERFAASTQMRKFFTVFETAREKDTWENKHPSKAALLKINKKLFKKIGFYCNFAVIRLHVDNGLLPMVICYLRLHVCLFAEWWRHTAHVLQWLRLPEFACIHRQCRQSP